MWTDGRTNTPNYPKMMVNLTPWVVTIIIIIFFFIEGIIVNHPKMVVFKGVEHQRPSIGPPQETLEWRYPLSQI
jgi:hypothetical protein